MLHRRARRSTTVPAPSWTPTTRRRCSARSTSTAATPMRNQPGIAQWNLARLAETLLPLLDTETEPAIERRKEAAGALRPGLRGCLACRAAPQAGADRGARGGPGAGRGPAGADAGERRRLHPDLPRAVRRGRRARGRCRGAALFADPAAYDGWASGWRARLAEEAVAPEARAKAMQAVNPAIIPRNHQMEAAIVAAVERGDLVGRSRRCSTPSRGPSRTARGSSATPCRRSRRSGCWRPSAGPDSKVGEGKVFPPQAPPFLFCGSGRRRAADAKPTKIDGGPGEYLPPAFRAARDRSHSRRCSCGSPRRRAPAARRVLGAEIRQGEGLLPVAAIGRADAARTAPCSG